MTYSEKSILWMRSEPDEFSAHRNKLAIPSDRQGP